MKGQVYIRTQGTDNYNNCSHTKLFAHKVYTYNYAQTITAMQITVLMFNTCVTYATCNV